MHLETAAMIWQCSGHAGHAIAMGAHDQVLEPYTEFVTKTVEEDGIAYAMKKYGLID